ncbi:MAG: VWA domain-containing protein [Vicinamibacterales bacterium]
MGHGAQEPVFRASVETVTVDVAVTRGGSAVAGLTARNFRVRDNGVPQVVDRLLRDDVPLDLMLVFDTSSSLSDAGVRVLADSAEALLEALGADDRVGVVTFSESVNVRVPLTPQHERVRTALRARTSAGPTAWRDAVFVATQLLEPRADARRVILLLTDGRDTSSWMLPHQIADVVRRSGVVLHAIARGAQQVRRDGRDLTSSFATPGDRAEAMPSGLFGELGAVVAAGGGRLWEVDADTGLKARFLEALDELRARYLVSYVVDGPAAPGWHDVSVTLVGVRGDVRARPGYWVEGSR